MAREQNSALVAEPRENLPTRRPAGAAIGVLLALPIVAVLPAVEPWLPFALAGAQVKMARTPPQLTSPEPPWWA